MGLALGTVPHMDSLVGLAIVFGVLGIGASAVDLGANTMLIWHRGSGVGRAMNLLHLCFGLGALASPLLVQLGLGIAATGGALAAFLIAGWALLVPPPRAPLVKRDEQTDTTVGLLALAAMFFVLYVGLEVGFGGWIHTYGEEIHFSADGATWLTALFWTSFTIGRLLAAWLAHMVVPRTLLLGACSLAVASALALVIGDGAPAVVWPATALFGLAVAPQFPVMFTYLERRINVTGSATSWFVCGAGVGGLIFPWLIGQWFDQSGADALPVATTLLAVATLAWFVIVNRVFSSAIQIPVTSGSDAHPSESPSEARTDRPQVGKDRSPERGVQVSGAGRAASARLGADRALDHLDVPVAPLLQPFVEVDEALAEVGGARVGAIHVEQDRLELRIGRRPAPGFACQAPGRDVEAATRDVIAERDPQRRRAQSGRDPHARW